MTEFNELPDGVSDSDIAIVGMAGRFPGARDVEEFWQNLRNGVESATWLTDDELKAAGVPEEQYTDPQYVKACYPLDNMDSFDAGFFGFAPREAEIMDPQQRHFLELAWTACEHAGHDPSRFKGSIGVYAGCGASTYLMFNLLSNPELVANTGFFLLRHTGNDKDFLATRVSYLMNLRGPSVNVQTACSTSLVAVHQGVQALLNHECDMVLAGGSTLRHPHRTGYMYQEGEIMSPDGHCRSFDENAEGTVFGSGSGLVVLRRISDAIADGDTIYAVIKGSAINNDGSAKVGYLAPSVDGQAQVVEEALRLADVSPDDVQYIECHGTATPVGDPIEVTALSQAYRSVGAEGNGFCAIGSVKSNIGHLDTAAGVAGLIKTVQAIRHAEIPPSLHYKAPNPAIDFDTSPFFVNSELRNWETSGKPRTAGVSALGAGGTNAHLVVQQAPELSPSGSSRDWQLYVLSAKTPTALDSQASQLAEYLSSTTDLPADIAFTLFNGRQAFSNRRAVVALSPFHAAEQLKAADQRKIASGTSSDRPRRVAFMFAGGGAQYPGMGEDLYRGESVYRAAVDECISLLQPKLDWNLKDILFPAVEKREQVATEMERPSRSLPCLFITQYAMAKLCSAWGLDADAMIGHSMGEYTAAHLAGVFSLSDALSLVTLRGQLFETVKPGGMLSVSLSAAELSERLPTTLSIAAINAPELCVASGPVEELEKLESQLEADEIDCRRVRINIAAHSSMLDSILADFGAFFRGIKLSAPKQRFLSNVTGTWISDEQAVSADYWVSHLRNTVRFADGIGVLLADEGRVLVEVGPGRTLATLASLHELRKKDQPTITSMRHPDEDISDVGHALGMVAKAWVCGVGISGDSLWSEEKRRRIALPTYPFEHKSYFVEPGQPSMPIHSLSKREDVGEWFHTSAWEKQPVVRETLKATGRWIVLHDESGVSYELVKAIREAADESAVVTSVIAGSDFRENGDGSFNANPSDPEQLSRMLAVYTASGGAPDRIVHAWNLGNAVVSHADSEGRAFYSLLGILQGVASEGIESKIRLDVITSGMQSTGSEADLNPVKSLVLGPVRVASREFPEIDARSIDVPSNSSARSLVSSLLRELSLESSDKVVALRGYSRFVQRFSDLYLTESADTGSWLKEGSVCLITGGLGGLGLLVAAELARTPGVKLVLMGRSGLADKPGALKALEESGAEYIVVNADVSDEAQLSRAVDEATERFGPITHLIHAAGLIEDSLIAMKDKSSAARVFAPKVSGTLALNAVLSKRGLEKVVLFSSRGSVAGVAGQVDYTSASAFLDAWSEAASLTGVEVLSIDWSAWQDVGIAASLGTGGPVSGRAVMHSLLDTCVRESGDVYEYRSTYSSSSHWLLDGHRIRGGDALIPGTGYLEIIRAAGTEAGTGKGTGRVSISDVFFISPFIVQDKGKREIRIILEGDEEKDITIEGRSNSSSEWEEHARASIAPLLQAVPANADPSAIISRCNVRRVEFSGSEKREHLILGERWSNIRSIDYGNSEAIATLALPSQYADELTENALHPALLDVATACAQALIPDYDGVRDFYIPVSYGRVDLWSGLEAECYSHIRLQPGVEGQDTAVYDVTVMSRDGRVLVDIHDFTMMRVKDRVNVGGSQSSSASTAPIQFRAAIRPDEGMDALRRLLASGITGQVIVSPQHLPTYLEALSASAELPSTPVRTVVEEPAIDVSEVEAVLATHESVHTVVVTAKRERSGGLRVTAFVVFELGEQATVSEIRRYLRGKVQEDLVPQHLIELEELPVDASGRVDRLALPDPFSDEDDLVGPRTEMEHVIARIWMELLGISSLSVYDNFLDVGGHSLLAMRAVSRIAKQTGVRLNPSVMTLHTLEQIAAECAEKASLSGSGSR